MKTSQIQRNRYLLLTYLVLAKVGGETFAQPVLDTDEQREAEAFQAGRTSSKEATWIKPRRSCISNHAPTSETEATKFWESRYCLQHSHCWGEGVYYLLSQKYECNTRFSGDIKILHVFWFLGFYPRENAGLGDKE